MLNVVTIYWADDATVAADGLQSTLLCDEAIQIARHIAQDGGRDVVVEDVPAREAYLMTADGEKEDLPAGWVPAWEQDE